MECQDVGEEEIFICEECGDEIDDVDSVYEVDDEILCKVCLCSRFRKII